MLRTQQHRGGLIKKQVSGVDSITIVKCSHLASYSSTNEADEHAGFSCDKEIEPIKFGAGVRYVRNDYTMTHLKMLTTIGDALTDMFASISPVLSAYVILFLGRNYTKENSRSLIFERAIRNQEMFIHPQNTTRHFIQIKFKLDNHT